MGPSRFGTIGARTAAAAGVAGEAFRRFSWTLWSSEFFWDSAAVDRFRSDVVFPFPGFPQLLASPQSQSVSEDFWEYRF